MIPAAVADVDCVTNSKPDALLVATTAVNPQLTLAATLVAVDLLGLKGWG